MSDRDFALAIDVGGTFTDVILASADGSLTESLKTPTTEQDPVVGCMAGIQRLVTRTGVAPEQVKRVVHATTLATNLVLSRTGRPVAYVTTRGFGDVPRIGREARIGLAAYDLFYEKPLLPVAADQVFEVDERIDAHGAVVRELQEPAIEQLCEQVGSAAPAAVAICLLNSYAAPEHERRIAAALRAAFPELQIAVSSEICPEFREYDRASTTIISAYIAPVLARYLDRLERELTHFGIGVPLNVMQSSGGIVSAKTAVGRAVSCLESGPAAGVIAAAYVGSLYGKQVDVISFDMGGTTVKAGLARAGVPAVTTEFRAGADVSSGSRAGGGGFPIKLPAVDLAEIGAGGGSIAWVDEGGLLRVGPQSAGADPGPACYGGGGVEPTTTDADLVLGYLRPGASFEGGIELSLERAVQAIEDRVAKPLGIDVMTAASGIHDIANAAMAAAVRLITVERGIDPRGFLVCGFGGAGPVHVAHIAAQFGIARIVIPRMAGVLSAVGLLASNESRDYVRAQLLDEHEADEQQVLAAFIELEREARGDDDLASGGGDDVELERFVDVRFRHQSHDLVIPLPERADGRTIAAAFRRAYAERFAVERYEPAQLVCFRLRVVRRTEGAGVGGAFASSPANAQPTTRDVYSPEDGSLVPTPVHQRAQLAVGQVLDGPAVIEEEQTTVVVPRGYAAQLDGIGNLLLQAPDQPDATASFEGQPTQTRTVRIATLEELLPRSRRDDEESPGSRQGETESPGSRRDETESPGSRQGETESPIGSGAA